jgi:hypothetical protein
MQKVAWRNEGIEGIADIQDDNDEATCPPSPTTPTKSRSSSTTGGAFSLYLKPPEKVSPLHVGESVSKRLLKQCPSPEISESSSKTKSHQSRPRRPLMHRQHSNETFPTRKSYLNTTQRLVLRRRHSQDSLARKRSVHRSMERLAMNDHGGTTRRKLSQQSNSAFVLGTEADSSNTRQKTCISLSMGFKSQLNASFVSNDDIVQDYLSNRTDSKLRLRKSRSVDGEIQQEESIDERSRDRRPTSQGLRSRSTRGRSGSKSNSAGRRHRRRHDSADRVRDIRNEKDTIENCKQAHQRRRNRLAKMEPKL